MSILVLNAGSSSLKFAVYSFQDGRENLTLTGIAEPIGIGEATLTYTDKQGEKQHESLAAPTHAAAAQRLLDLVEHEGVTIQASAHRVVHGGRSFIKPAMVNDEVISVLQGLNELAPLHNPPAIACLQAVRKRLPSVPAVLHFDTGFHAGMPPVAYRYALPESLFLPWAVRRYGFHGISYQWALNVLNEEVEKYPAYNRIIMCHLGAGSSMCAVVNGCSVDTTMGFTPQAGLVMATRSGDVDPGLLLYLVNTQGYSASSLEQLLSRQSGMLALSGGLSGDVRVLDSSAAAGSDSAQLALDLFAYRVRKTIGGYAAAMGGLDAVLFTGGIGQNSSAMRARIVKGLEFLGIDIDNSFNSNPPHANIFKISTAVSAVHLWVVAANEELQMARDTRGLLKTPG
jgi:acetate kinase